MAYALEAFVLSGGVFDFPKVYIHFIRHNDGSNQFFPAFSHLIIQLEHIKPVETFYAFCKSVSCFCEIRKHFFVILLLNDLFNHRISTGEMGSHILLGGSFFFEFFI